MRPPRDRGRENEQESMSELKIEVSEAAEYPNTTLVHLKGALSSAGQAELDEAFESIISANPPFVIAEMSEATLFTSSALGNFMNYRKRLIEKNGDLVFTGLSLDIKTMLNLLGAGRIFRMYNDTQSAINAYRWEKEHLSQTMQLSFPSELRFVPAVRQLVSRIAKQKNYGSRDSFRIETIVDEVCNNAVEHGDSSSGRNVELALNIDRERVELQVTNATNPDKADVLREMSKSVLNAPRPGIDQKRGRGLALIKMLSNDLQIGFSEEGTSVHVTRLRGE